MQGKRRKVCVVLVDRANYGRMKPVMQAIAAASGSRTAGAGRWHDGSGAFSTARENRAARWLRDPRRDIYGAGRLHSGHHGQISRLWRGGICQRISASQAGPGVAHRRPL